MTNSNNKPGTVNDNEDWSEDEEDIPACVTDILVAAADYLKK